MQLVKGSGPQKCVDMADAISYIVNDNGNISMGFERDCPDRVRYGIGRYQIVLGRIAVYFPKSNVLLCNCPGGLILTAVLKFD